MNRRALIKPASRAFAYFGHKTNHVNKYPVPRHDHIIEPFAGGAGYALRYADLKVTLYDIDEAVCELWDYLIHASSADILALPLIKPYQHVDELKVNEAAKQLIQRNINPLSGQVCNKVPPVIAKSSFLGDVCIRSEVWGSKRRALIAELVERIKHWKVYNRSYRQIENTECTWFIDPPYASKVSNSYKHTHLDICFNHLGEWCKNRSGQVVVCENTNSRPWLPFRELIKISGGNKVNNKNKRSTEVIWCSDERDYPMTQNSLL